MNPSIAVIIPTFNNKTRLRKALEHWFNADYDRHTVIVVNDGCTDGTKEMLEKEFPQVIQLQGTGNLWFAGSCNLGLKYAIEHNFDYATVFNDDNYVNPDLLSAQLECQKKYPGAILGIKSYKLGTDKILWAMGGFVVKKIIGKGMYFPGKNLQDDGVSYEKEFTCEMLDGSGQFYPIGIFKKTGFWDTRYQAYYADVEFALRAHRRGFTLVSNPKAIAYHDYQESEAIKKNKHGYPFQLFYLLFDKKSSFNVVNTFRFWFTYFPFSSLLTIPRYYAYMVKAYYIDPYIAGQGAIR